MIWPDIFIRMPVTMATVRSALADVVRVPEADVFVVATLEEAPTLEKVNAELAAAGGDFPQRLSVYVGDEFAELNVMEAIQDLSRILRSSLVVPDDSADPYGVLLVEPYGAVMRTAVDVESLDEHGEYRLRRE